MFLHLWVILFKGGLCPEGYLSGVGGLCPGQVSVQGGLCPGGVSVRETPCMVTCGR